MRTPVIAANWKCNMRLETAYQLASSLRDRIDEVPGVDKVVCPAFVHLASVEVALSMSSIKIGAQDMHWEDDVAATGEVGPRMLAELAEYVIIGHSERRHMFGETDAMVKRKLKAALAVGLQPIVCVGETLEERQSGGAEQVLVRQLRGAIDAETPLPEGFIIAYEPVWAIGTGTAATLEDAAGAIRRVRQEIAAMFGGGTAEAVRVLYGGSVTAENMGQFMTAPDIDGALVGGTSLKADAFTAIVEQAASRAVT
jgi:triosephosphate isomerase